MPISNRFSIFLSSATVAVLALSAAPAAAESPPDVAIAIHAIDGTAWRAQAIGGRTIAGAYVVPRKDSFPDSGAFTWDGSKLFTYPVVVFQPALDQKPDNVVFAVNGSGVAAGEYQLQGPPDPEGGDTFVEVAARFAAGKTTYFNLNAMGVSGEPVGGPYAVDARGDIAGPDGVISPDLKATSVAGLATASLGTDVRPGAIDASRDVAGTSTTLKARGNRIAAPDPSEPHVFVARGDAVGALARDLGAVPGCDTPTVAGMSAGGTIVGNCRSIGSRLARAWQWKGAFVILPPLPGDAEAQVSGISSDGVAVGTSKKKGRDTAVFWRAGAVAPVSSLIGPGSGDVFRNALGIGDSHWILVRGERGTVASDFLVVPVADAGAAAKIGAIPAGPTPIPSDAPTPAYDSVSTRPNAPSPAPASPTAEPSPAIRIAREPIASLHARWSGASPVESTERPLVATDGTRFYLAIREALEAFDAKGALVWKHPFAGTSVFAESGGVVVAAGPKSVVALDATSGARRWSVPLPSDVTATSPSLEIGHGTVDLEGAAHRYDLRTGRALTTPRDPCENPISAGGVVACVAGGGAVPSRATFFEARTGRKFLSLPGRPTLLGATPLRAVFDFLGDYVIVHPDTGTYDVLPVAGGSTYDRKVDGAYVVYDDGANSYRYRIDVDPTGQKPVPFAGGDARTFAVGDGVEANVAGDGGPLNVVSFDAGGAPSVATYDGIVPEDNSNLQISHGLVFATTREGVAVVDFRAHRVLGVAKVTCDDLYSLTVIGRTAVLGCRNDGEPTQGYVDRVQAIDLTPDLNRLVTPSLPTPTPAPTVAPTDAPASPVPTATTTPLPVASIAPVPR